MEKKPTTLKQHGRSFGTPDSESKSNFELFTEDAIK